MAKIEARRIRELEKSVSLALFNLHHYLEIGGDAFWIDFYRHRVEIGMLADARAEYHEVAGQRPGRKKMTAKERVNIILPANGTDGVTAMRAIILAHIQSAEREAIERCAKELEFHASTWKGWKTANGDEYASATIMMAAAIRALKEEL